MTTTEDTALGVVLERVVGQRMHAFSNIVSSSYYQRTEKPLGVALPEWRVLRAAILGPNISQGEIATSEGLNVMNVSRAVAGLRRKGLLEARADPDDRRRSLLTPTELGRQVGVDLAQREQVMYEHAFSVLSEREVELLDELLGRVTEFLRTSELPALPATSLPWPEMLARNVDDDGSEA